MSTDGNECGVGRECQFCLGGTDEEHVAIFSVLTILRQSRRDPGIGNLTIPNSRDSKLKSGIAIPRDNIYDVHLGLIGKCVVDTVIIELFSLGVTAESLRAKIKIDRKSAISLQRGQFDPKFQVAGDVPRQLFLHG